MIRELDDRRESASTGLHLAKPKGGHGHCEYWLVSGRAAWSSTFSVSWSCSFLSSAKYADSDWFRMRQKSCVCSASLSWEQGISATGSMLGQLDILAKVSTILSF